VARSCCGWLCAVRAGWKSVAVVSIRSSRLSRERAWLRAAHRGAGLSKAKLYALYAHSRDHDSSISSIRARFEATRSVSSRLWSSLTAQRLSAHRPGLGLPSCDQIQVGTSSGASGISITKTQPLPGMLRVTISPPWAETAFRAMDSPRPSPLRSDPRR
jgi:hypothetical protein